MTNSQTQKVKKLKNKVSKSVKFLVIMVIRDEDKWVESFRKFFEVEQRDFAEMKWHRLYGPIYRFFFPHSSAPMRVYMDFLRFDQTNIWENNFSQNKKY